MKHHMPDFHYAVDEDGCYWECGKENCEDCLKTIQLSLEVKRKMNDEEKKEKHVCKCEEEAGMGNVKSTRIEEIEYQTNKIAGLENDISSLYASLGNQRKRFDSLEEIINLSFIQLLRRRIKNWLRVDDKHY